MKLRSIKTRITLLITLLVVALFALMLLFAFSVSSSVVQRTARQQLADTVRANAALVTFTDGQFAAGEGFSFSRSGVSCLVYSKAEALLAGQLPVGFSETAAFENGTLRTVETAGGDWYLLDLWVADGWDNGVWLRGLMEVPDSSSAARNLLLAAAVALPLFVLAGAVYRRLTGRTIDQRVLGYINAAGFVCLMALMVLVAVNDVLRIIG